MPRLLRIAPVILLAGCWGQQGPWEEVQFGMPWAEFELFARGQDTAEESGNFDACKQACISVQEFEQVKECVAVRTDDLVEIDCVGRHVRKEWH